MSPDQLLFQMDHSTQADEWFDFDNSFEYPSGYSDSIPASVDSISPKDYELVYSDADALNWDLLDSAPCPQTSFSDFISFEAPLEGHMENRLDITDPNGILHQPSMSPQDELSSPAFSGTWSYDAQNLEQNFYQPSSFRHIVESQAAADTRCASKKEKLLEASIALHLKRLQEAAVADLHSSPDSSASLSSPCWSDSVQGSVSYGYTRGSPSTTPGAESTGKSSTPISSGLDSVPGAMELVLDLNMNTTTDLPKKQKPRSQVQKENYIKVRKHGACEKHRKQHKRCNCLDKAAARVNVNNSLIQTLSMESTRPTLPVNSRLQTLPISPTKAMATTISPNLSPTNSERVGYVPVPGHRPSSPALSPLESLGIVRPRLPPAGNASLALPSSKVRQPFREWRAVDQTPSVPGVLTPQPKRLLATQPARTSIPGTTAARETGTVKAVHFTPGLNHHSPGVHSSGLLSSGLLPTFKYSSAVLQKQTSNHDKLPVCQQAQCSRNDGLPVCRWALSSKQHKLPLGQQALSSKHDKLPVCQHALSSKHDKLPACKQALSSNPGTWEVPGRQGKIVQNLSIAGRVGAAICNSVVAFSLFWQSSTSLSSWSGACLGRFIVSASKQHTLLRKELGLYKPWFV